MNYERDMITFISVLFPDKSAGSLRAVSTEPKLFNESSALSIPGDVPKFPLYNSLLGIILPILEMKKPLRKLHGTCPG